MKLEDLYKSLIISLSNMQRNKVFEKWAFRVTEEYMFKYQSYFDKTSYPIQYGRQFKCEIRLIDDERYCAVMLNLPQTENIQNLLMKKANNWRENFFNINDCLISNNCYDSDRNIEDMFYNDYQIIKVLNHYKENAEEIGAKRFNTRYCFKRHKIFNNLLRTKDFTETLFQASIFNSYNIPITLEEYHMANFDKIKEIVNFFDADGIKFVTKTNKKERCFIVFPFCYLKRILDLFNKNDFKETAMFKLNYLEKQNECDFLGFNNLNKENREKMFGKNHLMLEIDDYVYTTEILNIDNIDFNTGEFLYICRNAVIFKNNKIDSIVNFYIEGNIYLILNSNSTIKVNSVTQGEQYSDLLFYHVINFI
ncbi:MAG: hypothetical protein E7205_09080 [Tissierellaceae bacterium]|nr:hypothetical protein [Tissierellaceae bacterium]